MSLILAMGLAACGGKTSSTEPAKSSSEPAPSSQVGPSSSAAPSSQSSAAPSSSSSAAPSSSSSTPRPSSSSSSSSVAPSSSSSSVAPSSSSADSSSSVLPPEPVKAIQVSESKFVNEGGKVYFKVTGTQENHTADEFKWAWGIRERNADFAYGKETPEEADFAAAEFDSNNQFVLKLCLTDIEGLKSGSFYRIYGGTPATYGDIAFTDTQADSRDTTRHYYLRADQDNSFVYDSVQPLSFTKASVVGVAEADLPEGVTQAGAYLKFGGVNEAGITHEMLEEWHTANKIAGNFQRTVPNQYSVHNHADAERFWKIEGDDLFFYVYVGFIAENNGWMMHFDLVSGNSGANLNFEATFDGVPFEVDGALYRVYADSTKSGPENYYGCLGVYREHLHNYVDSDPIANTDGKNFKQSVCSCGEKIISIDFKDFTATTSGKNLSLDNNNGGYKMDKGATAAWKICVNKEIKGAELQFGVIASSNDHLNRHFYNEADYDAAHKDDEGFVSQNTGGTPDKASPEEDPWRYAVSVGENEFAINNNKSLKENGITETKKLGYVSFASIDLAAGENTITLKQCNIGYRFLFNGEVRIIHKTTANIKDPNEHVHSWTEGTAVQNGDSKDVLPLSCACGKVGARMSVNDYSSMEGSDTTADNLRPSQGKPITYKIVVSKAGTYIMNFGFKCKSNGGEAMSRRNFTVTVGEGEGAVAGTMIYDGNETPNSLGMNADTATQLDIAEIVLAAGENTVSLVCASYRLHYAGLFQVFEK